MDTGVRGDQIRSRAASARRWSADERARACGLAVDAAAICDESRTLCATHRRGTSRRLVWETAAADDGVVAWPVMRTYVEFDSRLVGRDPVIEQAKTLLGERYRLSRADAFAVLRRLSSRQNRKVRDVARAVVAAPPDTDPAGG